jgi:hypothetical protein
MRRSPGGRTPLDLDAMSRRRFLQALVLGGAGLGLGIPDLAAATEQVRPAASTGDVNIFHGRFDSVAGGVVALDVDGRSASFALSPGASFWRGTDTSTPTVLRPGDDLLVRVENGRIERGWANLIRLRGTTRAQGGADLDLEAGTGYSPLRSYGLRLKGDTALEHAYSGDRQPLRPLPAGTAVDVIGLLDDGVVQASIVTYVLPGDRAPKLRPAPVEVTKSSIAAAGPASPQAVCSYTYSGIASYFSCSPSLAKCQTCSSSGGGACAWPYVTTGGTCDFRCTGQVAAWCGKYISVADQCKAQAVSAAVVDCGPCQSPSRCGASATCGHVCSDCKGWTTTLVDLTYATFALFYDPSKQKCFSCKCTNTVTC